MERPRPESEQDSPQRGGGKFSECECPVCGHIEEYGRNIPCYRMTCLKCGSPMEGY